LCDMAQEMFARLGQAALTAQSAQAAIETIERSRIDLVLTDVGLGMGMNGWELLDEVRSRWPQVEIAVATGWGAAIDEDEVRARAAIALLPKPYALLDLQRMLQAYAGAKAAAA